MVRLHFSRVIFQALDLYVYATRSDKWKTCLAWCGSVSSQRSSLANLNMQMSLRITTKPVQPLLTPCTWKKRVVFRRFSAIDRILSLTGNLEALSTNFCLFSIIFFRGKIFTVVGIWRIWSSSKVAFWSTNYFWKLSEMLSESIFVSFYSDGTIPERVNFEIITENLPE